MQTLAQTARRIFARLGLGLWLALVFALAAAPATAATITVVNTNDTGNGSLRYAIDTLAAAGDTIDFNLPPNSTIALNSTLTVTKNLTINGGSNRITISGGNAVRVFIVNAGVTATFANLAIVDGIDGGGTGGGGIVNAGTLTLTGCTVSGNNAHFYGGGIYSDGVLTLNNSVVSGNTASSGGGIYNGNNGMLALTSSTVTGNTATDTTTNGGGGIFSNGGGTLTGSAVSGNTSAANGGGIYNYASALLTLTNSAVSGNHAGEGGGIYNANGTLNLNGSAVSGNTATTSGGGITNDAVMTLTGSTVSGNNANGGISNSGTGTLTLTNSTVTGNTDGGVFNGHVLTAAFVTLADNGTLDLYSEANASLQSVIVQHCVFSGTSNLTDSGGNLDSGNACGLSHPDSKSNATLALNPLQDNGGPTLTMMPSGTSDALGAGVSCIVTDQRGAARPVASCTSGAVEASPTANPPQYRLTVQVTGNGSVSDNPALAQIVNCSITGRINCTGLYNASTPVTLTATPAAGQTFTGWGGACSGNSAAATVTMSQARTCTAQFAPSIAPPATTAAVPTLNQWALLLLGVLTAGLGWRKRRRI